MQLSVAIVGCPPSRSDLDGSGSLFYWALLLRDHNAIVIPTGRDPDTLKQPMKLFTALAALTLIAAPAHASRSQELALQKQSNGILEASLRAAQAGNWKTACLKYKENYAFRTQHGLNQFKPVTGSAQMQSLIRRQNELKAKSNAQTNKSGKFLCGKAGMTWTTVNVPTTSVQTTNVSSNIRNGCEKKWGTNYRMIKYCVDKQTEAARSLGY